DEALLAFTRRLIDFRKEHPVLRRRRFFQGRRVHGSDIRDITWFRPDGKLMTDEEWDAGWIRTLGTRLAGDALGEVDEHGEPVTDATLLILLSAHDEPIDFVLPGFLPEIQWELVFDTSAPDREGDGPRYAVGETYELAGRSIAVFTRIE
ncbi:MAG TPA: hypothetical protein PKA95_03405, partial [Thermomicrobiales bacterium]|nr:hypothetical protein [Thermomicrobiales bacterium]